MKRTVVWSPKAERELARLWLDSRQPAQVTAASNRIDQMLRDRADEVGEARNADLRILFESPLAIKYRIVELDHIVEVAQVWSIV